VAVTVRMTPFFRWLGLPFTEATFERPMVTFEAAEGGKEGFFRNDGILPYDSVKFTGQGWKRLDGIAVHTTGL